jgi:hypothetical protein
LIRSFPSALIKAPCRLAWLARRWRFLLQPCLYLGQVTRHDEPQSQAFQRLLTPVITRPRSLGPCMVVFLAGFPFSICCLPCPFVFAFLPFGHPSPFECPHSPLASSRSGLLLSLALANEGKELEKPFRWSRSRFSLPIAQTDFGSHPRVV